MKSVHMAVHSQRLEALLTLPPWICRRSATQTLTQILKSQCPSTSTVKKSCIEYF